MRLRASTWIVLSAIWLLSTGFLLVTGVAAAEAARLVLIVTVEAATGALLWRALRRGPIDVVEAAGMGLALGTALALVGALLVQALGLGSWGWLLPTAVAIAVVIIARLRDSLPAPVPSSARGRFSTGSVAALVASGILGLISLTINVSNYPLAWTGVWGRYHPDMLFFEALSTSMARFGPTDSIFMTGGLIRYHWLTYAWAGELTAAAGAQPFVVLTRVLPLVTTLAACLIAIAWARRLTRVEWGPILAVGLLLTGGYVGAAYGTILNFDSPSQSLTAVWLLALCLAFVALLERTAGGRRQVSTTSLIVTVGLLSFCVSGGKISSGAIAVASLGFVGLFGLVRAPEWRWRAVGAAAAAGVGLIGAYVLVVAGSADPGGLSIGRLVDRASSVQGLNPIVGSLGIVAGTLILTLAISVRWAGLAWLVYSRESRTSPATLLGLGLAISGLSSVLLISGGLNDTWFALAASAPLSVISAAGAAQAACAVAATTTRLVPTRAVIWAGICGLGLAGVVGALWATGASGGNVWVSSLRWLGPLVGVAGAGIAGAVLSRRTNLTGGPFARWLAMTVIVLVALAVPGRLVGLSGDVGSQPGLSSDSFTPTTPFVDTLDTTMVREWSADASDMGGWLRDHADARDIVATNITFSPLVPALSRLRAYVAGIGYQAPYGTTANLPVLTAREAAAHAFIDTPSRQTAAPLCAAGVTWIWVDPTRTETRTWEPFATVAQADSAVTLLRLDPSAC